MPNPVAKVAQVIGEQVAEPTAAGFSQEEPIERPAPNERAVEQLKADPSMAPKFDEVFGVGAAARALGEGEKEEGGFLSGVVDVAAAVPRGVAKALENTGDFVAQMADKVGLPAGVAIGSDAESGFVEALSLEELNARQGDEVFGEVGTPDNIAGESQTVVGSFVQDASAFLTDFVGVGKFFKGARVLQGGTKLAQGSRAAAQGAVADFLAFDAQESRLSNFLNEFPTLRNPVTEWLAADEDDGEIEGRLKNAVEGTFLGVAADTVFQTFKLIKKARRALQESGEEAAEAVVREGIDEIDEGLRALQDPDAPSFDPHDTPLTRSDELGVLRDKLRRVKEIQAESPRAPWATRQASRLNRQIAELEAEIKTTNRAQEGFLLRSEEFLKDVEAARAETEVIGPQLPWEPRDPKPMFNYAKMDSPDHVKAAMEEMGNALVGDINRLSKNGTVTLDEMAEKAAAELGDVVGIPGHALMQRLGDTARTAKDMAKTMLQAKAFMQSNARDIADLNAKILRGAGGPKDRELLEKMLLAQHDAMVSLKVIQREAARTTVAGRIRTLDSVQIALAEGDPKAISKMVGAVSRGIAIHNEFWVNSILSGLKTHLINISSNTIKMGLEPAEKALGGTLTGNSAAMREGFYQYVGLARAYKDAVRMSMKAIRHDRSFIDPSNTKLDIPQHAIQTARADALGTIINGFGKFVRLPTRLLTAEDEFFKQMTFRANLYSRAMRQGVDKGLRGEGLAKFVEDAFEKGIDDLGRGVDTEALRVAREATFTAELPAGTLGRSVQDLTIRHPWMRMIVPFVRTPTNILKDVRNHTPGINLLAREFREEIAAGGNRRAAAIGKMTTGTLLYGTALMYAMEGRITGAGPQDPTQRKNWLEAGHRPYSFVTTAENGKKVYTSFARLDPMGMILGLVADTYEISSKVDDATFGDIATAGMISLAHNITNKSYLQGITQVLDALSQPDRHLERFMENRIASYVPAGIRQVTPVYRDEYMREVDGSLQAIKSRIPGLSQTLLPRRSWVTGEPIKYDTLISPFPQAVETDDFVISELARIQHGFGAPAQLLGKVKLNQEQYDRLVQLGANPPGRKSLRDALASVMQRDSYDLNRERREDPPQSAVDVGLDSSDPRVQMVSKVIRNYRDRAKKMLLREFPELKGALRAEKQARKEIRRGDAERIQQFLDEVNQNE